ncbi:hypothetical protein AOQ84DRAFT_223433 [Glonium stellatum]|uniref:Uncharacterized protein n=1 Tax=Glonium stellatum TaxID=574774 RepID=A0A8E2EY64_9PEZI|nr:hypothetical protein AOQ84DRAFT_223433 [Glonium stellatum]
MWASAIIKGAGMGRGYCMKGMKAAGNSGALRWLGGLVTAVTARSLLLILKLLVVFSSPRKSYSGDGTNKRLPDMGGRKREVVRSPNTDSALNNATAVSIVALGITIGRYSVEAETADSHFGLILSAFG